MSDLPTDPHPERPEPPGETPPPPPQAEPRKLTRSTSDRVIGGVAGGLGRYFNIDPLAIRIAFVILAFAGAFGVIAYLVCLLFVPTDDPDAPPRRSFIQIAGVTLLVIAACVVFAPRVFWGPEIAVLAVAGLLIYMLIRAIRDDGAPPLAQATAKVALGLALAALAVGGFAAAAAGTALGGGIVVAGLVVACGVALVGGAFRGGARWLAVPALVLAIPLGVVAAADLDLRGSWGERTFRPASVAELADGYEMGAGEMTIDLRDVTFPPGRTNLPLELGMGEIQVIAPEDVCVTTDATTIGMGVVIDGDDENGGVDIDIDDPRVLAPGVRQLNVTADIGMGALQVGDQVVDVSRGPFEERPALDLRRTGTNRAACVEA